MGEHNGAVGGCDGGEKAACWCRRRVCLNSELGSEERTDETLVNSNFLWLLS